MSILDYLGGPDIITQGKQEGQSQIGRHCATGFEDGGTGHEPRNAGSLPKLEKTRKRISPGAFSSHTAFNESILAH